MASTKSRQMQMASLDGLLVNTGMAFENKLGRRSAWLADILVLMHALKPSRRA